MENSPSEQRYIRISTRSIFYSALVVGLIAVTYYIRELVFVFLTAIVVASFVEAGVRTLRKHGMGRSLAVILIYFLVLTSFGLLIYLFVPVFFAQIGQFSAFVARYLPSTTAVSAETSQFSHLFTNFQSIAQSASGGVIQFAIAIFGGLFNLIVLIVLSFYLSMNERAIETFLRLITPQPDTERVVGLWKRTERKIGLWFQGQLILAALVGVLIYIALLIIGVQYSLLLALLAAVMELIPFGIILAAVPAIASGFITHGSTGALVVAGVYLIVHELEINIISPLIVQKVVGISSFVVILSILVGLEVAGFWGVILGVPAAVLLMEVVEDFKQKKGIVDTIG